MEELIKGYVICVFELDTMFSRGDGEKCLPYQIG